MSLGGNSGAWGTTHVFKLYARVPTTVGLENNTRVHPYFNTLDILRISCFLIAKRNTSISDPQTFLIPAEPPQQIPRSQTMNKLK